MRVRATLDDPLDAVCLFLVIGTGLAAGVQLLFVALVASILFNAVTITVWRLNVGSQPAVVEGWRLARAGTAAQRPAARRARQARLHHLGYAVSTGQG